MRYREKQAQRSKRLTAPLLRERHLELVIDGICGRTLGQIGISIFGWVYLNTESTWGA
jgi:hypothetical protein